MLTNYIEKKIYKIFVFQYILNQILIKMEFSFRLNPEDNL
jgi:hypothetical protein